MNESERNKPTPMPATDMLEYINAVLADFKAVDPKVLDVRENCNFTDYMVFASGTSDRHLKAMASEMVSTLKKQGVRPMSVEGDDTPQTEWVLVDFVDVVVHLMMPETRLQYQLEKLWSTGDSPLKPQRAE